MYIRIMMVKHKYVFGMIKLRCNATCKHVDTRCASSCRYLKNVRGILLHMELYIKSDSLMMLKAGQWKDGGANFWT